MTKPMFVASIINQFSYATRKLNGPVPTMYSQLDSQLLPMPLYTAN